MKKVVICASAVFYEEALGWKQKLTEQGYSVIRTIQKIDGGSLEQYEQTHTDHYAKMSECNMVFVLNPEKRGIPGYIGPSVFAEIAFAIGLNVAQQKNIEVVYLNPWPVNSPFADELTKWQKLGWIKQFESTRAHQMTEG